MSVARSTVLDFLRQHRYAVQSSVKADGGPQAALVGFVVTDGFEFFFDSFASTRKAGSLGTDPRIALVIGGHTIGDERTVQVEGVADQPSGDELLSLQERYFAILPDGRRRSKLPGVTYFRVRPRWLRYSDYNVTPPLIVEFEGSALSG